MHKLTLDVSLANELKISLINNGWTEDAIRRALERGFLREVRLVLEGKACFTDCLPCINLDSRPADSPGSQVVRHNGGGNFMWNPSLVVCHLSNTSRVQGSCETTVLLAELKDSRLFNVNLLDFLLEHPYLIPMEWEDKFVYFLGTVYRDEEGDETVRYLCRPQSGWASRHRKLSDPFTNEDYVAIHASSDL